MAKSSALEVIGQVVEVLPAGKFKVALANMDFEVVAKKSGKMRMNNIAIMEGDYVRLEVNEYDISQGRITFRFKGKPEELNQANSVGSVPSDG